MSRARDPVYLRYCVASAAITCTLLWLLLPADGGIVESITRLVFAALVMIVGGVFTVASFFYWLLPPTR
jgi:hypothetical protein